mmetsp:Transcript_31237/g.79793  ORF Transcript_31237/g.79793 Transcript_31237/m.79793 type:complete len:214 (+) Transcript_31237:212-853(+)
MTAAASVTTLDAAAAAAAAWTSDNCSRRCCLRADSFQRFLTAFCERPGSILAILDHGIVDIPRHCSTRSRSARSSSSVHSAGSRTSGAKCMDHRSLHCLPLLLVLRSWAISDQFFGPRSSTSCTRRWSSAALHGLGDARARRAEEPAPAPCAGGGNLSARPIEDSPGDAALCAALQPPSEDAALSSSEQGEGCSLCSSSNSMLLPWNGCACDV